MEWIIEANDTEEAAEGKFAFIREVVRCKDCVYGKPFNDVWQQPKLNGIIWCAFFETRQEDWFCGYGERREDGV